MSKKIIISVLFISLVSSFVYAVDPNGYSNQGGGSKDETYELLFGTGVNGSSSDEYDYANSGKTVYSSVYEEFENKASVGSILNKIARMIDQFMSRMDEFWKRTGRGIISKVSRATTERIARAANGEKDLTLRSYTGQLITEQQGAQEDVLKYVRQLRPTEGVQCSVDHKIAAFNGYQTCPVCQASLATVLNGSKI